MFGFNPDKISDTLFNKITSQIAQKELRENKQKGVLEFRDGTAAMTVVTTDDLDFLQIGPAFQPADKAIAQKTYQQYLIKKTEKESNLPSTSASRTRARSAAPVIPPKPLQKIPSPLRSLGTTTEKKHPVASNSISSFSSTYKIQTSIEQFLAAIDQEIDQMTIPERFDPYKNLAKSFKNPFALYRQQFESHRKFCDPEQLNNDLKTLREMQQTMYFAARSPDAKPVDLQLKGIKNRGYDCLPISQNQYELHNQYFVFFIMAYQLLGEGVLALPSATTVKTSLSGDKELQALVANLEKSKQKIATLTSDNAKKETIIAEFNKNNMPTSMIAAKQQQILINEAEIKALTENMRPAEMAVQEKKSALTESKLKDQRQERKKLIKQANLWSVFYQKLLSNKTSSTIYLPEPFKNEIDRGNDFPTVLFNVPYQLSTHYYWYSKDHLPELLKKPWKAVMIDMNGGHFFTYVKRQNGSIAELNDSRAVEYRYKNVDELIRDYTRPDCKSALRIDIK